jgi:hypothetical protein
MRVIIDSHGAWSVAPSHVKTRAELAEQLAAAVRATAEMEK